MEILFSILRILMISLPAAGGIAFYYYVKNQKVLLRRCVYCSNDSFLIKKGVCTLCRKNHEGIEVSVSGFQKIISEGELVLKRKGLATRVLLCCFLAMALTVLLFTILKILQN